jgi:hypothetical protein
MAQASKQAILSNNENNTLPVHLIFTKEINRKKDAMSPQKTVKGNVILFISERTIDKFNIPVFKGDIPLLIKKKSFIRNTPNKIPHNHKESEVSKKTVNKTAKKVKILYGYNPKSYDNSTDHYLINFPYFFNISMIRDSLFLMFTKNKEGTRFMCLPSQKKRDIFIGNKDMVNVSLGNGKLIQGMNIDDAKFGECTIVVSSSRKKRMTKKTN